MELDHKQALEIRSEEVDEIISQMPGGLIRWGIGLIFALFIMLLFISWFIKYPDVIKAKIVVTTDPAPISLVSRSAGKIILLKKDNEEVIKNDVVAYLQTNAVIKDIDNLETSLANFETSLNESDLFIAITRNLKVGDLQTYMSATVKALLDLQVFTENKLQKKQIEHIGKQITSYKNLNQNLQKQLSLMKQEGLLSERQFKTDSLLLTQQVMAILDFNKTKSAYLSQQRSVKNMEASIISNQLQVDGLEKQVTELEISLSKEHDQLQTNFDNAVKELSAQIKGWKENFLFVAPTNGTIAYLGFIENGQYSEIGKPLFTIVTSTQQLIARGELPLIGSGKVKTGQVVNIQLTSYPYEQFGMLIGKIESISQVPEKENYTLVISLPNGMTTTHNKELQFKPQLHGDTEIITEDLRLLERVFYQFRKLAFKI
ncbi:MAG: HlyD family efflux transporter periplasmic adaptor subunit [Cytophagales bacterium]|nr:HlyD family efflux transporter periplasmic adaptor subunit [Cytophagales bacterium]MCA6373932.1 HlyD family efflux transporter periplasmic adaptor subunit [Cytophagales bacterium]MCA6377851.1 HlyD family efflux transporter periplasmic adaptor subunit [Cytophagales bacterium]MCA6385890.1 HlyD family efflux transporter periplasmic adaptor subunit [Cytophagales bacterium]